MPVNSEPMQQFRQTVFGLPQLAETGFNLVKVAPFGNRTFCTTSFCRSSSNFRCKSAMVSCCGTAFFARMENSFSLSMSMR
jgi:hypothetical protein